MAQEAFHYPAGPVPTMDLQELIRHIRLLDPRVFWDLSIEKNPDETDARNLVLDWLQCREPVLFETLDNIMRAYQTAYFQATETTTCLTRAYHRYRLARNTLEDEGRQLGEELEKQIEQEKPALEKKRAREPQNEEADREEVEQIKELKQSTNQMCEWYLTQEKFSNEFPIEQYRHFTKKGVKKWSLDELNNFGTWDTIYHAAGPWQAEMLVEHLEKNGRAAIIIKKFRGGADQEMMSYKVISGIKNLA
jgi:hypothetical protein